METWRQIKEWEGYEVSNYGRVRSWKKRSPGRVWIPRYDLPPHILRPGVRNGYLSVILSEKGKGTEHACIHRLVLETFVGLCPEGYHGAHNDGDKRNNRLENLRWATPAENNADKKLHGTHQFGENIGTAKLTRSDVQIIIERRASGAKVAELAAAFGVCRNTITNITTGRSWIQA